MVGRLFLAIALMIAGILCMIYATYEANRLEDEVKSIRRVTLAALLGATFITSSIFGFGILTSEKQNTNIETVDIRKVCEENAICYELVETVAEHTDYTEQEVVDFFIIVSDDIDAWMAIRLLDGSLTDKQIDAILELSALKQGE